MLLKFVLWHLGVSAYTIFVQTVCRKVWQTEMQKSLTNRNAGKLDIISLGGYLNKRYGATIMKHEATQKSGFNRNHPERHEKFIWKFFTSGKKTVLAYGLRGLDPRILGFVLESMIQPEVNKNPLVKRIFLPGRSSDQNYTGQM